MELGCHSKKSGNVQTGDRDNANAQIYVGVSVSMCLSVYV